MGLSQLRMSGVRVGEGATSTGGSGSRHLQQVWPLIWSQGRSRSYPGIGEGREMEWMGLRELAAKWMSGIMGRANLEVRSEFGLKTHSSETVNKSLYPLSLGFLI